LPSAETDKGASNQVILLAVPHSKTRYGDRSFQWLLQNYRNSLPAEITSSRTINTFKSALKAWLFEKYYASQ
jgi:hypothetical protein